MLQLTRLYGSQSYTECNFQSSVQITTYIEMSETEIQQVTAILTAKGHIAAAIYQIRLRISTAHWISNIYFRFCPCLCFLWPVTAFNVLASDLACGLLITHEWSWVGYFCRETTRRPPEQCGKFMNNSSKGKGHSSYQSRPTCCRTLLLWMGVHADVASQTTSVTACVTVMVSGQQILRHHLCTMLLQACSLQPSATWHP